jgi:hypothetical protein
MLSFVRQDDRHRVFAAFNLSPRPLTAKLAEELYVGDYTDVFRQENVSLPAEASVRFGAWDYRLYIAEQ